MTWTPGPWAFDLEAEEAVRGPFIWADVDDVRPNRLGGAVASCGNEADARLIALAPEMAELLERVQALKPPDPIQREIAELLSRARGEDAAPLPEAGGQAQGQVPDSP